MGNWISRSRGRVVGFGAVVIVGVCVVLAAPVLAYVARATKTVTVKMGAAGTVTASCPKGEHITFGGVAGQLDLSSGRITLPEGMRRTASNHWTVNGLNVLLPSPLTAFGYCGHGLAAPTTRHTTGSANKLGVATAVVTCPPGTVVVGGGFLTGSSRTVHEEVVAALERTSPTKWLAKVLNLNNFSITVTAIAYCGGGPAPTLHTVTQKLGANTGGVAHATCPTGTSIVFGGLVASSPQVTSTHGAAVLPFRWTAPSSSEWDVSAFNGGDRPGSVESLAYCR